LNDTNVKRSGRRSSGRRGNGIARCRRHGNEEMFRFGWEVVRDWVAFSLLPEVVKPIKLDLSNNNSRFLHLNLSW